MIERIDSNYISAGAGNVPFAKVMTLIAMSRKMDAANEKNTKYEWRNVNKDDRKQNVAAPQSFDF